MQNIAVIFGGKTVEHDISIITGLSVIKNLSLKYNVVPIYIDTLGNWWTGEHLKQAKSYTQEPKGKFCYFEFNQPNLCVKSTFGYKKINIDCAVLALHGGMYEGGAVQGVLEISNIPYTSPNVLGSSLCMDKVITKLLLKSLNINTPKFISFNKQNEPKSLKQIVGSLNFPLIVKPARCGSSIGVTKVLEEKELSSAVNHAFLFDDKIIIEECLQDFKELNIALFKENNKIHISSIEEIKLNSKLYDFNDKYKNKENIKRIVPAQIPLKAIDKIVNYATQIYEKFDLSGLIRIDCFLTENKVFVNEINTIPGSFAFYLWKEQGLSFAQILNLLIKHAILSHKQKQNQLYKFNSDVLSCLNDIEKIEYK
ncbi:MAG: D-alanine--D-alanine ligase [Clostridia bacterium]|nr:D-alanine--D-alanine ligase [Clostridia bacterium]